jgi:hypothetical protein
LDGDGDHEAREGDDSGRRAEDVEAFSAGHNAFQSAGGRSGSQSFTWMLRGTVPSAAVSRNTARALDAAFDLLERGWSARAS